MTDESVITTKVGFPLYDGCTLLDFAGATQIFTPFAGAGFEPIWLAQKAGPIKTTEGVEVLAQKSFADAPDLDVLFVPGGGPEVATCMRDKSFIADIIRLAENTSWVGSVCTGAFILATAGLLDGHRATTYWSQLENLALFPNIEVDVNAYPRELIENGRFTGGGISSSIDLALALVERLRDVPVRQTVQLANQYAPEAPQDSGDPEHAPQEITDRLRAKQQPFTDVMRKAVDDVLGL